MSTLLTLQPGSLPSGYCWTDPQTVLNDFMAISSAVFGGSFQTFVIGSSTPSAADRDKPWFRIVTDKLEGIYYYANGYWLRPHPVPAASDYRAMWVGSTDGLKTFDGGADEATGANDYTGPMWEVDTNFAAKSPMGPGTLTGSGTIITVDQNHITNDQVTLTADSMPAHVHTITAKTGLDVDTAGPVTRTLFGRGETDPNEFSSERDTGTAGSSEPFSIVHPVRGIYLIKRTVRAQIRV